MQKATDVAEVSVSETGAVIPADTLRAAGIRPGDRVAFARTTRDPLVVVPAVTGGDGPSLRTVVGANPRPVDVPAEVDQVFLRDIRHGDDGC